MNKISPNMLRNICSIKNVNEMFLDYENNKDYFSEGTLIEYLNDLFKYIDDELLDSVTKKKFILDEEFISSIINVYNKYYFPVFEESNNDWIKNSSLFGYLKRYKNRVEIDILRKEGPFSFESNEIRNNAIKISDIQLRNIDNFLKDIKYNENLKSYLEKFDIYLLSNKKMTSKDYNDLLLIFENAGDVLPEKYVELFFKNVINHKKPSSVISVSNALESIALNSTRQKGINAYYESAPLLSGTLGTCDNEIVGLSSDEILAFVEDPLRNAVSLFNVLFHEIVHLYQEAAISSYKKFSYSEIKILKDDLLARSFNRRYREENYFALSYELDARSMGRIYAKRFLKKLGANRVENTRLLRKKEYETDQRIIGYKQCPIDHLFDECIVSIVTSHGSDYAEDVFKKYPLLNLMYTKEGRRYTSLELFQKREEYKSLLDSSKEDEKNEFETHIHNINEILYNQNLSYINTISDYKELTDDKTLKIDPEEKKDYLENYLYTHVSSRNKKSLSDIAYFIRRITGRPFNDIKEYVEATIKTGDEMLEIFREKNIIGKTPIKEKTKNKD